jgi:hypothetical protein
MYHRVSSIKGPERVYVEKIEENPENTKIYYNQQEPIYNNA